MSAARECTQGVTVEAVADAVIEHQPFRLTDGRYGCMACDDQVVFSTWRGVAWHIARRAVTEVPR